MDRGEEVAALLLAFWGHGLERVVDGGEGQGCGDGVVWVFGLWVGKRGGVEVAVAVAGDFEQAVLGRDHEEAVGEVEDCGAGRELCFFGRGDGHVADGLAGCFADAAQVDERGCPGAGCEDCEGGVEFGVVAQSDAGDGVGFVVDEQLFHGAGDEVDSLQFLYFFSQPLHCSFGIGPARAPVHVSCFATAPFVVPFEPTYPLYILSCVQNFRLV